MIGETNMEIQVVVALIVVLAIYAGMIVLQVFLSKKDSKWLGLILPAVCFLLSFLYPMAMISTGNTWQDIGLFAVALLLGNIPTVILLVLYAALRESRRKKAQLEKMNIQDLK
jgi:1,4-dihydroxy-2-naphthoate octaprenyltransferase